MPCPEAEHINAFLAGREADVPDLRNGVQKRVQWADKAGVKTAISVVFVHGFSATSQEIRPVPDRVAEALGANLHFTRLAGHGQDGAAMGRATLAQWQADVAEALTVARAIGDRVIVISCSTGSPLVAMELLNDQRDIAAAIYVSPNFGMTYRIAQLLLDMPGVRRWGHYLMGRERSFKPISPEHGAFWTTRYDSCAVYTMAEAVRAAWAAPMEQISVPSLRVYCEADRVVRPALSRLALERGQGGCRHVAIGKGGDPNGHLILGDIFSPKQTDVGVRIFQEWLRGVL